MNKSILDVFNEIDEVLKEDETYEDYTKLKLKKHEVDMYERLRRLNGKIK